MLAIILFLLYFYFMGSIAHSDHTTAAVISAESKAEPKPEPKTEPKPEPKTEPKPETIKFSCEYVKKFVNGLTYQQMLTLAGKKRGLGLVPNGRKATSLRVALINYALNKPQTFYNKIHYLKYA